MTDKGQKSFWEFQVHQVATELDKCTKLLQQHERDRHKLDAKEREKQDALAVRCKQYEKELRDALPKYTEMRDKC